MLPNSTWKSMAALAHRRLASRWAATVPRIDDNGRPTRCPPDWSRFGGWLVMCAAAAIFNAVLVFGLFAAPYAWAQPGKTYRVAMLEPFSTEEGRPYREAFLAAVRELGYVEGRNLTLDLRTSDRDRTVIPVLVEELIALKPDVLVSDGNAVQILREKTTSIPIVLTASTDPVGEGFALSLAHPGMNVTGGAMYLDELSAKHIEMMREILPRLKRVGMFGTGDRCRIVEDAARQASRSVGAVFVNYPVANRDEIEQAFSRMRTQRPDVILRCPMALLFNNRDLLYEGAVRLRVPFTSFVTASLPLGVLLSYSPSFADGYRRAAAYVDKILKGARPGDLPFERPAKLELVINLKTARAFGLTVPQSMLLRADRVIE
jgi:putative ABC transport system substrate-binding protein